MGFGTRRPCVLQIAAREAVHRHGPQEVRRIETGAVDDDVEFALLAILRADTGGRDFGDAVRHDIHMIHAHGGPPVVREKDALAARLVIGRELPLLFRIGDVEVHLLDGGFLELVARRVEGAEEKLAEPVGLPALDVHGPGERPVERLFPAEKFALRARQHPARRTLEDGDAARFLRDLGHELDGARAIADDGDALALEVDRMVPLRGVPAIAPETLAARNVRPDGTVKLAGAGRDDIRLEGAVAGLQRPEARLLVETRIVDFGVEADVTAQPVFVDDGFEIGLDVGGEDILLLPTGPHVEGELIHVQRHVAGTSRIGVLPPRSADLARLLVDREVGEAFFLELDRRADAGDARAENGHARAFRRFGPRRRIICQCHCFLPAGSRRLPQDDASGLEFRIPMKEA